jgi:hypothetical protein
MFDFIIQLFLYLSKLLRVETVYPNYGMVRTSAYPHEILDAKYLCGTQYSLLDRYLKTTTREAIPFQVAIQ